jgi:DNA helicase II / ATP-dependent DNA helicase PcrA
VKSAMAVFSQKILVMNDFQAIIENLEIEQWVQEVYIEEQRKIDVLRYFEALKNAILKYKNFDDYFSQLCDYEDRRASKLKTRILTIALASEIKGFEFDNVLIPYLEDGIFPFDTGEGLQEEQNLLYVAATRAKKNLCLLVHENKPSRFLRP